MKSPVIIPGTHSFDLAPRAGGPAYRIFLAVPETPAPAGGFPAVYMLDANSGFATLVETQRRGAVRPRNTGIASAVLIGIGYPTDDAYDRIRRGLDYTPGPSSEAKSADETAPATGGRDAFLAFIENELKPAIAGECPVDMTRQTLFGHSLAGYFVLDVLARDGDTFQSYVAVSPSIWWDEPRLRAGLAAAPPRPGTRLAIMVGEWEQALAPWQRDRPDRAELEQRRARRAMVDRARAFAEDAGTALGPAAQVRFEMLAGEDHASVLPVAMSRALRFVLSEES